MPSSHCITPHYEFLLDWTGPRTQWRSDQTRQPACWQAGLNTLQSWRPPQHWRNTKKTYYATQFLEFGSWNRLVLSVLLRFVLHMVPFKVHQPSTESLSHFLRNSSCAGQRWKPQHVGSCRNYMEIIWNNRNIWLYWWFSNLVSLARGCYDADDSGRPRQQRRRGRGLGMTWLAVAMASQRMCTTVGQSTLLKVPLCNIFAIITYLWEFESHRLEPTKHLLFKKSSFWLIIIKIISKSSPAWTVVFIYSCGLSLNVCRKITVAPILGHGEELTELQRPFSGSNAPSASTWYVYVLSLFLLEDNCLQRPSRTYPQTPLGRWRRSNKPMVNRVEKTSERSIQDNLGQDTSSQWCLLEC